MKLIEQALNATGGYINTISRDTVHGWWVLEVGLPKSWVYDNNQKIDCETVFENDLGCMIKISPKTDDVVIDDLISFVEIIISTNEKIALKEKEFTDKMQEMKNVLENEAKKFYQELDDLKEKSFNDINSDFVSNIGISKSKSGKKTKKDGIDNNIKEDVDTIESTDATS
jgi:hypothetical protein